MATPKKQLSTSSKKRVEKTANKKSTSLKTVSAKTATRKAPSRPVAKTTVRRTRPQKAVLKSFRPVKETQPFMTFKVTDQTIYWLILSLFVLALGMWVVTINDKVQKIYDEIDRVNAAEQAMVLPLKKTVD